MLCFNLKSMEIIKNVADNVGGNVGEIILLLNQNPKISQKQIAEKLEITTRTVERHIKNLKLSNKITRVGSDRAGEWVVND